MSVFTSLLCLVISIALFDIDIIKIHMPIFDVHLIERCDDVDATVVAD